MSEPHRPTERRVDLDGLAVTIRDGDGSEPPVVLVHGGMDRSSSFGRVLRHLPGVPVTRYDRRGYGRSQPGVAVDLDRHVADLLAVVGDRRPVVFGHSLGGTVALTAAARHPGRIAALAVYESPTPWLSPPRPHRGTGLRGLAPAEAAERFMISMVGEGIWNRLPAATRDARRAEGAALLADIAAADGTPRFDPAAVTIPVLVGSGGAGEPYRAGEADDLAAALPDAARVVVDGARHGVHLADPAATAGLIRRLRGLAARPDTARPDTARPDTATRTRSTP